MRNGVFGVDMPAARQRTACHRLGRYSVLILSLLLWANLAMAQSSTATPPSRGSAEVGVVVNLTNSQVIDTIGIRLEGQQDAARLRQIADLLGAKFGIAPTAVKVSAGDPAFIQDHSLGIEFNLPVMPRNDGYLPIAPFIEVLAPYASKVQIAYIVQGDFHYLGFERYTSKDVSYTVDPPETSPANIQPKISYFRAVATINSQSITVPIPRGQVDMPVKKPLARWIIALVVIMGLALLGILAGLAMTLFSSKGQSRDDRRHPKTRDPR